MVSQWCFLLPHPLALKLPALRMETPASHHINMTFGLPSYRWERSSLGDLAVRSLRSNFMKVCLTQVTSLYSGRGSCTAQRWGCDCDWYTETFSAQNARGEGQLWKKRPETTKHRHDMHVFPTITVWVSFFWAMGPSHLQHFLQDGRVSVAIFWYPESRGQCKPKVLELTKAETE